jgi:hypothetical protein
LATDPGSVARYWYVIDRVILRERGHALFGPSARELFAPLPRAVLLRALSESARWHAEEGVARDDDAVLNACRAWRFAAEGAWSSRPAAGAWARSSLDDQELVSEALAARHGDGRLDRDRVEALLRASGEASPVGRCLTPAWPGSTFQLQYGWETVVARRSRMGSVRSTGGYILP